MKDLQTPRRSQLEMIDPVPRNTSIWKLRQIISEATTQEITPTTDFNQSLKNLEMLWSDDNNIYYVPFCESPIPKNKRYVGNIESNYSQYFKDSVDSRGAKVDSPLKNVTERRRSSLKLQAEDQFKYLNMSLQSRNYSVPCDWKDEQQQYKEKKEKYIYNRRSQVQKGKEQKNIDKQKNQGNNKQLSSSTEAIPKSSRKQSHENKFKNQNQKQIIQKPQRQLSHVSKQKQDQLQQQNINNNSNNKQKAKSLQQKTLAKRSDHQSNNNILQQQQQQQQQTQLELTSPSTNLFGQEVVVSRTNTQLNLQIPNLKSQEFVHQSSRLSKNIEINNHNASNRQQNVGISLQGSSHQIQKQSQFNVISSQKEKGIDQEKIESIKLEHQQSINQLSKQPASTNVTQLSNLKKQPSIQKVNNNRSQKQSSLRVSFKKTNSISSVSSSQSSSSVKLKKAASLLNKQEGQVFVNQQSNIGNDQQQTKLITQSEEDRLTQEQKGHSNKELLFEEGQIRLGAVPSQAEQQQNQQQQSLLESQRIKLSQQQDQKNNNFNPTEIILVKKTQEMDLNNLQNQEQSLEVLTNQNDILKVENNQILDIHTSNQQVSINGQDTNQDRVEQFIQNTNDLSVINNSNEISEQVQNNNSDQTKGDIRELAAPLRIHKAKTFDERDSLEQNNDQTSNQNIFKSLQIKPTERVEDQKVDKSDLDINQELEEHKEELIAQAEAAAGGGEGDPSFLQTESEPNISALHESQLIKSFSGILPQQQNTPRQPPEGQGQGQEQEIIKDIQYPQQLFKQQQQQQLHKLNTTPGVSETTPTRVKAQPNRHQSLPGQIISSSGSLTQIGKYPKIFTTTSERYQQSPSKRNLNSSLLSQMSLNNKEANNSSSSNQLGNDIKNHSNNNIHGGEYNQEEETDGNYPLSKRDSDRSQNKNSQTEINNQIQDEKDIKDINQEYPSSKNSRIKKVQSISEFTQINQLSQSKEISNLQELESISMGQNELQLHGSQESNTSQLLDKELIKQSQQSHQQGQTVDITQSEQQTVPVDNSNFSNTSKTINEFIPIKEDQQLELEKQSQQQEIIDEQNQSNKLKEDKRNQQDNSKEMKQQLLEEEREIFFRTQIASSLPIVKKDNQDSNDNSRRKYQSNQDIIVNPQLLLKQQTQPGIRIFSQDEINEEINKSPVTQDITEENNQISQESQQNNNNVLRVPAARRINSYPGIQSNLRDSTPNKKQTQHVELGESIINNLSKKDQEIDQREEKNNRELAKVLAKEAINSFSLPDSHQKSVSQEQSQHQEQQQEGQQQLQQEQQQQSNPIAILNPLPSNTVRLVNKPQDDIQELPRLLNPSTLESQQQQKTPRVSERKSIFSEQPFSAMNESKLEQSQIIRQAAVISRNSQNVPDYQKYFKQQPFSQYETSREYSKSFSCSEKRANSLYDYKMEESQELYIGSFQTSQIQCNQKNIPDYQAYQYSADQRSSCNNKDDHLQLLASIAANGAMAKFQLCPEKTADRKNDETIRNRLDIVKNNQPICLEERSKRLETICQQQQQQQFYQNHLEIQKYPRKDGVCNEEVEEEKEPTLSKPSYCDYQKQQLQPIDYVNHSFEIKRQPAGRGNDYGNIIKKKIFSEEIKQQEYQCIEYIDINQRTKQSDCIKKDKQTLDNKTQMNQQISQQQSIMDKQPLSEPFFIDDSQLRSASQMTKEQEEQQKQIDQVNNTDNIAAVAALNSTLNFSQYSAQQYVPASDSKLPFQQQQSQLVMTTSRNQNNQQEQFRPSQDDTNNNNGSSENVINEQDSILVNKMQKKEYMIPSLIFRNTVKKFIISSRFFKGINDARDRKKEISQSIFDDLLRKAMAASVSRVFTACKKSFAEIFTDKQPLSFYLLPANSQMYTFQLMSLRMYVLNLLRDLSVSTFQPDPQLFQEKKNIMDSNSLQTYTNNQYLDNLQKILHNLNNNNNNSETVSGLTSNYHPTTSSPPSDIPQEYIHSDIDILRFLNLISQNYQFAPQSFWSKFVISRLEFSPKGQIINISKPQQKMISVMFIMLYGLLNRLVRPWVTLNIERTSVIAKNCQIILSVIFYSLYDYIDNNNPIMERNDIKESDDNPDNDGVPLPKTQPFLAYPEFLSTETTTDLDTPRHSQQEEQMMRMQQTQTFNMISGISSRYLLKELLVKDVEFVAQANHYFDVIACNLTEQADTLYEKERFSLFELF